MKIAEERESNIPWTSFGFNRIWENKKLINSRFPSIGQIYLILVVGKVVAFILN